MYELTILTGRQYFWEPNKISFTIFGYLHYFILITKVQLRIKMKSYFYFPRKNKTDFGPTRPTRGSGPRWGAHARTGTLTKTPLDYEQNNPQSMLLFLETTLIQKDPCTLSSLQRHGPRPSSRTPV